MYFDLKECGKRIAKLRKERGLTQDQLAEKLNISTSNSNRFRAGRGSSGVRDIEQHRKLLCSYIDRSDDHNEKESPPADPLSDREAPYPASSLHSAFGTAQDDR